MFQHQYPNSVKIKKPENTCATLLKKQYPSFLFIKLKARSKIGNMYENKAAGRKIIKQKYKLQIFN